MLGLAGSTDRTEKARLCAPPVSIYERACMYTSLLLDFFLCAQRLVRRVMRGILPAVRNCSLVTIYVVGRNGVPLVLRNVCVGGGVLGVGELGEQQVDSDVSQMKPFRTASVWKLTYP